MGKGKRKRGNTGWSDRPKKENGAGEYPRRTRTERGVRRVLPREGLVPPAEWDEFKAALKQPLGIAFRIIGHADDPGAVALRASMEREFVGQMGAPRSTASACRRRSRSAGTRGGWRGASTSRARCCAARAWRGRTAPPRRRTTTARPRRRRTATATATPRRRRRRPTAMAARRRRRRGRGAGRRRGGRVEGDARRLPPLADGGGGGGQHLAAGGGVDGAATRPRRAPGPPRARHVREPGVEDAAAHRGHRAAGGRRRRRRERLRDRQRRRVPAVPPPDAPVQRLHLAALS